MSKISTREALRARYPNTLSEDDRRTYRNWVRGLFSFYASALVLAMIVLSYHQPARVELSATDIASPGLQQDNARTAGNHR